MNLPQQKVGHRRSGAQPGQPVFGVELDANGISINEMCRRYRIASGRPGEPDAPLKGVGVKMNRNS